MKRYTEAELELARAAITHEPSDHGKLSAIRMRVWQDALDDLRDELFPERVLAMIVCIETAKAMRVDPTYRSGYLQAFDEALAALEKEQK